MVTTSNGMVSVRNLIDGDISTPLRKFTAILDSMPTEEKVYGDESKGEKKRTSTVVHNNFKDLEVIESVDVFQFPIVTIDFTLSNRKKSKFGIYGQSVADILDMQYSKEQLDPTNPAYIKPDKRADLNSCIGKRLGLIMMDGENGRPAAPLLFDGRATDEKNPRGKDMPTPTWQCFMIEGVGVAGQSGLNPTDKAYQLLDGRTSQQFRQAAILDELVRSDVQLLAAISSPDSAANSFVNVVKTGGMFTMSADGIYHRVAGK